jgi:hypothetical protein
MACTACALLKRGKRVRRTLLLLFASMVIALLVAGGAALAATLSSVPDAGTVQTNGRVVAVLVADNAVYLGGYFTQVNGVIRNHLAAIDATTGKLTGWNPNANNSVRSLALSSDGSRIYAGGGFSKVGGLGRKRLAAIDASTGAVDSAWKPQANDTVYALATSGQSVYLGGKFTTIDGQSRAHLALVDATSGTLAPNWTPSANDEVRALGHSSDGARLYVGGPFTTVNGTSRPYLAALSPTTGALSGTWLKPTRPNGRVFDVEVSGGRVYTAEGGAGGAAAVYDGTTGVRAWMVRGDGDAQSVAVLDGKVYVGGHFKTLSDQSRQQLAALDATTGALDPQWNPNASLGGTCTAWQPSTCGSGVWTLTADPSEGRLYGGGDFRKVSGEQHAGFVQFSGQ